MKAIIFDFDNCLCPGDAVGAAFYEPGFAAIRQANRGLLSDAQLAAAFSDCWRQPLDFVARSHGFSEQMLAAGWSVFSSMEMTAPMAGYADLAVLHQLPVLRFLVTSGFRRLQESKIRALGIGPLFTEIRIDAIDEAGRKGKQGLFAEIMERHRLASHEILVVGDSPASEIQAGINLGITSIQILRPGVAFGGNASHHIKTLAELKPFLDQ